MPPSPANRRIAPGLPAAVWVLGGVSLLMDISSESIHSLLPLFMVAQLGASPLAVGLVEGLAEATALVVRVFSGALSDFLGRRKGVALAGYALGALAKPLFAVAASLNVVLAARLLDRLGKGIRGAPRDALVADLTPLDRRGAAFGLRQSLDTVGAFAGPLLAFWLMTRWHDDYRAVFWVAVLPGAAAVLLLAVGLRDPRRPPDGRRENPIQRRHLARLGSAYWWVVGVGALLTLARFSEAFLVLRAQQSGAPPAWIPLVMVAMNAVYGLSAYPAGRLADRIGPGWLLRVGLVSLIAAEIVLGCPGGPLLVLGGVALWGVHLGLTQGVLAAMVAQAAPADLRGTAFGMFSIVSGAAMLVGSGGAGYLWQFWGWAWTFHAGAGFSLLALAGLTLASRRSSGASPAAATPRGDTGAGGSSAPPVEDPQR